MLRSIYKKERQRATDFCKKTMLYEMDVQLTQYAICTLPFHHSSIAKIVNIEISSLTPFWRTLQIPIRRILKTCSLMENCPWKYFPVKIINNWCMSWKKQNKFLFRNVLWIGFLRCSTIFFQYVAATYPAYFHISEVHIFTLHYFLHFSKKLFSKCVTQTVKQMCRLCSFTPLCWDEVTLRAL